MQDDNEQQWGKREGYGGPDSFPEDGVSGHRLPESDKLVGQSFELHLADERVLTYVFTGDSSVRVEHEGGEMEIACEVIECAPQVFFINHPLAQDDRQNVSLVLDLARAQAVIVEQEIPREGDADFQVRKHHVAGCIGTPATSAAIKGPPFPPDLVGKRFVADYGDQYAWEVIYLNDHRVAWHGIRGNPGIGDVEQYHAHQFAPGVYVVSWSEEAETLAATFLYNFNTGTITGHMFGYAPDTAQVLNIPLGGRIVDSAEYGLVGHGAAPIAVRAQQRNKDAVLRQHYEVWNQAKYDIIDEIYAPDYACHFIDGYEAQGCAALQAFIQGHRVSFPDWTEEVVDIVAEGDRVVTRYRSTGTHLGEFQGIAATGRQVVVNEVSIYRVLNGRICEQWGFPDGVALMRQITED